MPPPPLVLASSSANRKLLLERFGLPFVCQSPDIDETPRSGERAEELVCRLSREKAERVAGSHPGAVIVASDQVADLDGVIFGKPGALPEARRQLSAMSGKTVRFHNGLAVLDQSRGERRMTNERVMVTVDYRVLSDAEIERYLQSDQPWSCAGSLQSETLGITMVERIQNNDPAALIGLPLIALARLLRPAGYVLP